MTEKVYSLLVARSYLTSSTTITFIVFYTLYQSFIHLTSQTPPQDPKQQTKMQFPYILMLALFNLASAAPTENAALETRQSECGSSQLNACIATVSRTQNPMQGETRC